MNYVQIVENKKRLAQDHGKKSSDSLNNSSIITARRNSQGDEDSDNEELEKKLLNLDLDRLNTEESDSKSDLGKSMTDLDARSRIPQRKDIASCFQLTYFVKARTLQRAMDQITAKV